MEVSTDFETAFSRSNIDAVVLATPAETHKTLALRAMQAGKDVYVEKPMALDFKEGIEMRDFANKNNRILMVGHILEYHAAVLKLKEMIANNVLGKVNYIHSTRLNFGKIRVEENALWSFAPHDIAVILRLFGESPIEVTCSGGSYITPNLADVTVSCLHFRSGQRAHIFVSWLNPFKEQKLVIVGDEKMAVFDDVQKKHKLQLFNQHVGYEKRMPILNKGDVETVPLDDSEPLRTECEHFLDCIVQRKEPISNADSGIEVLKVLQACQTSLQLNGHPVLLSDLY